MRRYLGLALAFLLAVVSVSALAMGLGEIRLNSHLNQRLDAEIELVSAAADELESLKVGLASREAYDRYGLERDPVLNTLQFRVVRRPNGTAYVKVTSSESIKEPFLTFLIEANWSRGKLLREYTVLLDPPTFAAREEAPAEATAPAVQPQQPVERTEPAEPAREAAVAEPEQARQAVEQPRVAEEQTSGDVINIPSLDTEDDERPAAARARQQAAQAPEMGGTYGPIKRNETLWGLAMRLRPDESITINQMMMALYRANPEAFQGNINHLKAGYILRIPEYSEIRGLDRGEAFREAKRHNDDWEARRAGGASQQAPAIADDEPQPAQDAELSLVAPEEESVPELGTGVGAGGEADDLGLAEDTATAPDAADDIDQDATGLGLDVEPSDRLLDIEDESLQALQSQDELARTDQAEEVAPPVLPEAEDEAEAGGEETVAADETAETDEAAVSEPAETSPVVAPVRRPEPGLLDRLMEPLGLGIVAALMVLLLAGVLVFRKRREASQAKAAAAVADWNDEDESDDVTVLASSDDDEDVTVMASQPSDEEVAGIFEHDFGDEDTGTRKLEDDTESTQLIEEADKTQLISPKQGAETNFEDTMVGGQSVTLDDNDPTSEADFHMAYGLYDQAAEVVQRAIERDPSRTDWLAKLAEIHFAANNTEGFLDAARSLKEQAGPGDSHWENVAIMGRQIASDDPLFAETGGSTGSVDLDFGSAGEEFGETAAEPEAKSKPAAAGGSDDVLDFDMSFDSPSESEPAEDAAPAAKPEEPSGDDSELDFDMDLGDFASTSTPAEPEAPAESAKETSASDSDFDFDLGEFGDQDAAAESQPAAEAPAGEPAFNDAETQTEFDRALQELSAYVDTNLPEQDAGDAVGADDDQGGDLNLDEFNFDQPDEDLSADTSEGTGDDEDDIGEIGTKLDLARAYIDMGDPDGARGILDEVLADGDEDQKKEAQDLMAQLG